MWKRIQEVQTSSFIQKSAEKMRDCWTNTSPFIISTMSVMLTHNHVCFSTFYPLRLFWQHIQCKLMAKYANNENNGEVKHTN